MKTADLKSSASTAFSNAKTAEVESKVVTSSAQGKRRRWGQVQTGKGSNRDSSCGEGIALYLDCGGGHTNLSLGEVT